MTKKDYIKLAEVFNKHSCEYTKDNDGNDWQLPRHKVYFNILARLTTMLKKDNPRFDADKFMQAIE